MLCVSQPSDATKSVALSTNYQIKQKQSEFERNDKTFLGFERCWWKIDDIEKYFS